MMVDRLAPPPEHDHQRWHWIETKFGVMPASWIPMIGSGLWNISGNTKAANDPSVLRGWKYIGPAIPPEYE